LRKLVWEDIEKALPAGTHSIYLCLDGNLARLPFAALPGRKKGILLLEDYALTVVPAGPWLLQQLRQAPANLKRDTLLAVGAVDFGKAARDTADYRPLPATGRELNRVLEAFGSPKDAGLRGRSATASAVLERLPKASIAHLATHGYFDEQALDREARRFLEWRKHWQFDGEGSQRAGVGAANPLGFVGGPGRRQRDVEGGPGRHPARA
jgi:CHAT domain-containing protein